MSRKCGHAESPFFAVFGYCCLHWGRGAITAWLPGWSSDVGHEVACGLSRKQVPALGMLNTRIDGERRNAKLLASLLLLRGATGRLARMLLLVKLLQ